MVGVITEDSLKCAGFTKNNKVWVKSYPNGEFEQVTKEEVGVKISLRPFDDESEFYDLEDYDCCPFNSEWFDTIKG